MGRRCCVTGCNSTSRLPEHEGVTYHTFPLDPTIRGIWMRNTRFDAERQITKSVLVCSRHFRRADFNMHRNGKFLLKQRVFPTVFPWGKIDPMQLEADLRNLRSATATAPSTGQEESTDEEATTATVEAKVAQIMAEAAELNAQASGSKAASEGELAESATPPPHGVRFEAVTNFTAGVRVEAQDFDGIWHAARVVEVDNDDREVLIKFERSGKVKSAIDGTEEWIPMNSTRLRQKVCNKPIPVFALEEKCMARWSGPRKFPGTVKKVLSNDSYEVLFDDGYVKNVRAVHMSKVAAASMERSGSGQLESSLASSRAAAAASAASSLDNSTSSESHTARKRQGSGSRRDWPLLDMSTLDLKALKLPEIPHDGEWTCHWVNDQPIGREGFLVVGEHRKPTVIVEDWRLPPGWVKHMYQRSNVLGKWDVILVSPSGKRFRSKADLKLHLEEQGKVYNPDIYDFSIHRRRAKDINAYVFTPDYTPQPIPKPSSLEPVLSQADSEALATSLATASSSHIETPVATPVPPLELMTPTSTSTPAPAKVVDDGGAEVAADGDAHGGDSELEKVGEDGYAYIGGLKVQIIDNLFRCPQEGCSKNFRKENHLQIHVKHYHRDLVKLLGACPKMLELAEKRTHTIKPEHESTPRNQMSNQQFFAKMHQQDIQQSRSGRKLPGSELASTSTSVSACASEQPKLEFDVKSEPVEVKNESESLNPSSAQVTDSTIDPEKAMLDETTLNSSTAADKSLMDTPTMPAKRARFAPSKTSTGSRKSNRQRTTRSYLTATPIAPYSPMPQITDSSFGGVSDFEETRHSFNVTPDGKVASLKRSSMGKGNASPSGAESPATVDSGSQPFQSTAMQLSGERHREKPQSPSMTANQYIKENGELIKIVHMRQEEIINCVCSYGEEDGLMIQCELCLCWQHGFCNGIDKESDVPEKYVCYICRNPLRGRESMRFIHDQDWLYDGKLPVANYHTPNPNLPQRFELLKRSHTLTGNLLELKRFMHSLRVKISIADNRSHPKLYLWSKKWDDDSPKKEAKLGDTADSSGSPAKKPKLEEAEVTQMPNVPQPEAPIDPEECQQRLLEHIKNQQGRALERLHVLEADMEELERQDELNEFQDSDIGTTKEMLAAFIKELDVVKQFARLNALEIKRSKLEVENAGISTVGAIME